MSDPVPPDEKTRLCALEKYEVFGTAPEPEFDRLTALAAHLFQVPVALVSLIGEETHWLKSHHGTAHYPLARDLTFCVHALSRTEAEGVLVIPDTTRDPRSASNPAVTGPPHVRFYAGAPLRTKEGQVLGTFCLTDTRPREFSPENQEVLTSLAATVMDLLELRLAARRLHGEIEERERVGNALWKSERTLRQIAANAPGMVYQFLWRGVADFSFPFVGEGCREFFGVGPAGLYQRPTLIWEVLQPEDIATMRVAIARSAQTLEPCHFELPFRAPDGSTRWMQGVSRPQRAPGGGTLWNGVLLDVTDRRLSQQQLEETNTLLSAVNNGTTDAIFIRDLDSRYLMINPAGAAFFGLTPPEVVGRADGELSPPDAAGRSRAHDRLVLESGATQTYEANIVLGGVPRAFLSTKTPYRDAAGNLMGVIGIARDISELRRAAEELRAAKEEAERANDAKSEFLSRMSHELRTPLNAILGFGQLLEIHGFDEGGAESVKHILKAGRHLLNLIDEVLALSRIETGRLRLSLEPVRLREVVGECLGLVDPLASEWGVRCVDECHLEEAGPGPYLLADRQRLRQVLLNLLSNAVKYNRPGGSVRLTCERVAAPGEDADGPERLRLLVTDTGVGLSAEELARLFTPFDRLKAAHTRTEGTGLGLALSKGLVEAMGGAIGVRSVPDEGSTFWIEFPLAEDPHAAAARHRREALAPEEKFCRGTVLHIEDNLTNARLLEMLLEDYPGVDLLGAEQGSLGLYLARSRRPDLILLDLHLPDIPGWEVLATLQGDPATRDIPVVIVSADATPNQVERLRRAGAREYMTKPIDVPGMVALLHEHLPDCEAAAGAV